MLSPISTDWEWMWASGGGWMQEWSMIWEWLMDDCMMWMKTDPSDKLVLLCSCSVDHITAGAWGVSLASRLQLMSCLFHFFPRGLCSTGEDCYSPDGDFFCRCVWACLFALCLSIRTTFARQVKREATIEFSHKDVGVASLISALHLRDLALGEVCNWKVLTYIFNSLQLIWVPVVPLFGWTPAQSTEWLWHPVTPPNTKGDQSECMRCQSYGKNGWLSSV